MRRLACGPLDVIAASLLLALSAGQTHPVAAIDSIVNEGIQSGVYPGAVVAIGTADTVLMLRGFGGLTWKADAPTPSPDSTFYDLASLTKVVATTPALMRLVDRGVVRLDEPVARFVPDWRGERKAEVQVEHLLAHTSGLRAFLPLNEQSDNPADARRLVVTEPLRWPPGTRVVYSDLNAMLLAWVVEGATGLSFDAFVRDSVHAPLGMTRTQFRLPRAFRDRAAPINRWRGHPIAGVVHDQNAERLGGVAGHAGLYSTARDLVAYARMYLRHGRSVDGTSFVADSVVDTFIARRTGHRALGWEVNDTTSSGHTGDSLSARAFGHGGYTGSSIWIDPDRNLFVVLLTNRVYAPRTGRSISRLRMVRADVADEAVRLHGYYCGVLSDPDVRARMGCGV